VLRRAVVFLAVLFLAVLFFAVLRRAVVFFAVLFLAVLFLAVLFLAVLFLAVLFFAVGLRAVVFFVAIAVPFDELSACMSGVIPKTGEGSPPEVDSLSAEPRDGLALTAPPPERS
jgi:hypothetical protein